MTKLEYYEPPHVNPELSEVRIVTVDGKFAGVIVWSSYAERWHVYAPDDQKPFMTVDTDEQAMEALQKRAEVPEFSTLTGPEYVKVLISKSREPYGVMFRCLPNEAWTVLNTDGTWFAAIDEMAAMRGLFSDED